MSSRGAEPAYRGYRLQALYTLSRILSSEASHRLTFQPEGREDLAILEETGELVETVQVKAYSDNLTISDFSPEKPRSFFHRAMALLRTSPRPVVKIVSFGPIGPEMTRAWKADGDDRRAVSQKLLDFGFSSADIDTLFHWVQLVKVDEGSVRDEVFTFLKESLLGGDPEHAFDLLNYWLYRASETKEEITYDSLIAKINNVGRYLVERATHYQEWFISIVPIEDRCISENERETLTEEFYQGMAARYEHILGDVDVVREGRLQDVAAAFQEKRVVIVHGASGQGKTALAYRYLHDFVPEQWRFEVRLIKDRQHALTIARALAGHANAVNAPMVVYIDVSYRDKDWPDLIRELAHHQNLHLLVTIREEDWRRASISGTDFQFKPLELAFDEVEAHWLYPRLASCKTPDRFLTFEDAWRRFGSGGPLLEFVYLVTQDESLRERLQQQIKHLQDEVRTGQRHRDELDLLRLVSVASAYEARVNLKVLVEQLELPAPERTLDLFEREYLLRRSPDGRYVEGLHPIRSAILVDFLMDPVLSPWPAVANACLPMIVEDDLEVFLLHAFSRRTDDAPKLLEALSPYRPRTWTGLAGVLRALLWLGVQEYVTYNQKLIREAFERVGPGWTFMLDFDIANVSTEFAASWWKNLDAVPDQMGEAIEDFRKRQTPKETVFEYATNWLARQDKVLAPPSILSDWGGVAETNFWAGYLYVDFPVSSGLTEADLEKAVDTLPLHYLGDVMFGLSFAWRDRFYDWLDKNRTRILNHFREETQTVVIEDDGETIRAHFVVDFELLAGDGVNGQTAHDNRLHDEALQRVEILRKLLPDREKYGCQGYGHRLGALELPSDDTEKPGIPVKWLLPSWPVRVNSVFRQLGVYPFRPHTWQEYAQAVHHLREMVLASLQELQNALIVHFRKKKPVKLRDNYIDTTNWNQCRLMTSSPPLLPRCAVDEWGFTGEDVSARRNMQAGPQLVQRTENVLALGQYRSYVSALREFTFSLSNFYWQSIHVLALNAILGKTRSAENRETIRHAVADQGIKTDLDSLSTHNLAEMLKALPRFQEEFRQHFSQFFDESSLDRLERRERDVFMRTWSLWYQFAFHPGRIWQNADQEAFKRLNDAVAQARRDIRKHFRKLSTDGIQATILSEDVRWENQPTLWIAFDIPNPVNLYTAFEAVLSSLRGAMGVVESNELKRFALDFWWPTIAIVPLTKGKSLSKTAWKFTTNVFLSGSTSEGYAWWDYVQYPVPPENWDSLKLQMWEHPRLELADQFQNAVAVLSLLIAHLCDLDRLPEVDEEGKELLQDYISDLSGDVSGAFQQVLDRMAEMVNYFNSLVPEERERHPALITAMQALVEMRENIMPDEHFDGELKMDLASAREWMQRLETARGQAEFVRLYWAADVLDLLTEGL
jgi:hypothetical protein